MSNLLNKIVLKKKSPNYLKRTGIENKQTISQLQSQNIIKLCNLTNWVKHVTMCNKRVSNFLLLTFHFKKMKKKPTGKER